MKSFAGSFQQLPGYNGHRPVNNARKVEVVGALRDYYVYLRRRDDNPFFRPGKTLELLLDKIADYCIANNVTAKDYILAMYYARGSMPFHPSMLNRKERDSIIKKYLAYESDIRNPENRLTRYENEYRTMGRYLLKVIGQRCSIDDALMDPALDFTSWFRVLVSTEPAPFLVKYGSQARKEIEADTCLLAFLKEKKLPLSRLGFV